MSVEHGSGVSRQDILRMTADIVAAFSNNNQIGSDDLMRLITKVHQTLEGLSGETQAIDESVQVRKPAVPVRRSVNPDFLVCLEDGRKLKMLKRHLRAAFNMTPEEYRSRWNLPTDYPMVAPNYAKKRSEFAKKMGLGKR